MHQPYILAIGTATVIVAIVAAAVLAAGAGTMLCFRRGRSGQVLIRRGPGGVRVAREGVLAWPLLHKVAAMNVTMQCLQIERRGDLAVRSSDGRSVELRAAFTVAVGESDRDVLAAWERFGDRGVSDEPRLRDALEGRLIEAVTAAVGGRTRDALFSLADTDGLKHELIGRLGPMLGDGLALADIAIEFFEPVRAEQLADRENAE